MARTTGPLVAAGTATLINQTVFNKQPINWRIPIATGIAAVTFSFGERIAPRFVVGVAYIALVTTLIARVVPNQPTPVENALKWWNQK